MSTNATPPPPPEPSHVEMLQDKIAKYEVMYDKARADRIRAIDAEDQAHHYAWRSRRRFWSTRRLGRLAPRPRAAIPFPGRSLSTSRPRSALTGWSGASPILGVVASRRALLVPRRRVVRRGLRGDTLLEHRHPLA